MQQNGRFQFMLCGVTAAAALAQMQVVEASYLLAAFFIANATVFKRAWVSGEAHKRRGWRVAGSCSQPAREAAWPRPADGVMSSSSCVTPYELAVLVHAYLHGGGYRKTAASFKRCACPHSGHACAMSTQRGPPSCS